MKRSSSITLLALGISLSACGGGDHRDRVNHCDRSNSDYDQAQCDQQIEDQQHQYHHNGVVYYPWFRNNFNNAYTPRLSYGWNHGSTVFAPVPTSSTAIAALSSRGVSVGEAGSVGTSAARGGFGASGAHAAAVGGGE